MNITQQHMLPFLKLWFVSTIKWLEMEYPLMSLCRKLMNLLSELILEDQYPADRKFLESHEIRVMFQFSYHNVYEAIAVSVARGFVFFPLCSQNKKPC